PVADAGRCAAHCDRPPGGCGLDGGGHSAWPLMAPSAAWSARCAARSSRRSRSAVLTIVTRSWVTRTGSCPRRNARSARGSRRSREWPGLGPRGRADLRDGDRGRDLLDHGAALDGKLAASAASAGHAVKNGIAQRRRHKPSAVTFRRPETANAARAHGYWYRRCSGCGEVKRLHDNFQRRGGRRDAFGLVPRMYYCKSCMRARSKAAYEHTKQTNTYAYLKMRERVARNQKAWREANPEKYRAQIQRGLAKRTRRYWDDPEYRRALLDASTERKRLRRLQAGLPIRARRRG